MNEHFRATKDLATDIYEAPRRQVPKRGYGRVDHVELDPLRPTVALVAIDLVDADWLDAQAQYDDKFAVYDPSRRSAAWQGFKLKVNRNTPLPSPFEKAPIFRLEVELPREASWFGLPPLPSPQSQSFDADLARLEAQWIELDTISEAIDATADGVGLLYPGLFSEPIPVIAQGRLPGAQQGNALSDIFSLAHLPDADTNDLKRVLSHASADLLAVYDVGQGNANALLSGSRQAMLYFDMGAGVYRNRSTTPPNLRFCLSARPTIILSHWDADHWAGACATSIGGIYPALQEAWIAPLQVVGPVHVAFAYDIVTHGGTLNIYSASPGTVGLTSAASGQSVTFTTGTGATRNGSGIVVAVEEPTLPAGPGSWLLTGDCDYGYFMPSLMPAPSIAIVVPHHGADLHSSSSAPAMTTAQSYRRIVYSFGKDNAHGSTGVQHPTQSGVSPHINVGWNHGTWMPISPNPGCNFPGGDALATCEHSPGTNRGGSLIGWDSAPIPFALPCGGTNCSASLVQS